MLHYVNFYEQQKNPPLAHFLQIKPCFQKMKKHLNSDHMSALQISLTHMGVRHVVHGPDQDHHIEYIVLTVKYRGGSVMIWASMSKKVVGLAPWITVDT